MKKAVVLTVILTLTVVTGIQRAVFEYNKHNAVPPDVTDPFFAWVYDDDSYDYWLETDISPDWEINPEKIVRVGFNFDVDESTINSNTVQLCTLSWSATRWGKRECGNQELDLKYDKESKVLTVTIIGDFKINGGAAYSNELWLTNGIKSVNSQSLRGSEYPNFLLLDLPTVRDVNVERLNQFRSIL